jgi:curved DNA-binding protein CbpA
VPQGATEREIKQAFKKRALKLHPDVNQAVRGPPARRPAALALQWCPVTAAARGPWRCSCLRPVRGPCSPTLCQPGQPPTTTTTPQPDAQERFMEAKAAFETLSDSSQRAEYDMRLRMVSARAALWWQVQEHARRCALQGQVLPGAACCALRAEPGPCRRRCAQGFPGSSSSASWRGAGGTGSAGSRRPGGGAGGYGQQQQQQEDFYGLVGVIRGCCWQVLAQRAGLGAAAAQRAPARAARGAVGPGCSCSGGRHGLGSVAPGVQPPVPTPAPPCCRGLRSHPPTCRAVCETWVLGWLAG